jgi:hypothetical protein
MIFDSLSDIVKHTHGLGFISAVKVTGTSTEVEISAMEENRAVVLTGKLNTPIEGLEGTVGLSRMGVLSGYLNFNQFNAKGSKVEIATQERGGVVSPCEVTFESPNGHAGQYRFMSSENAESQIKVPAFKGVSWAFTVVPSKNAVKDLSTMNNILGSYEDSFTVKTSGDQLEFHIGSGSTDRSKIVFATGIKGSLKHSWRYPISQMLSILKLNETSKSTTVSFSDAGCLQIEIDSGLGVYTYILPARSN